MAERNCSVGGCERAAHCRGWCKRHYERWRIHGTTADPACVDCGAAVKEFGARCQPCGYAKYEADCAKRECTIPGCNKPRSRQWQLCRMHAQRKKRHGDPLVALKPKLPFWERVNKAGPGGCWLWTGAVDGNGYGTVTIERVQLSTHRVAYELLVGPIPAGLTIDHLCRVLACCNPAHLEPVTRAENNRRKWEAYHAQHP